MNCDDRISRSAPIPPMTILTISKRGTLKLPKDIVAAFHGTKHLQVRTTNNGVLLTPVQIQLAVDMKAIPQAEPKR